MSEKTESVATVRLHDEVGRTECFLNPTKVPIATVLLRSFFICEPEITKPTK